MKIFHKGIYVEYIHKIETLSKAHSNNVKIFMDAFKFNIQSIY